MTLIELEKMRRLRAKPAFPVVITNQEDVHEFCASNDIPVMWQQSIKPDADLRPLYGLDVWIIGYGADLSVLYEAVKSSRPASMWVTGRFAFAERINKAVGREAMTCK